MKLPTKNEIQSVLKHGVDNQILKIKLIANEYLNDLFQISIQNIQSKIDDELKNTSQKNLTPQLLEEAKKLEEQTNKKSIETIQNVLTASNKMMADNINIMKQSRGY